MFLRTDRLLLRPAWHEDAQPLYDAINDEAIITNLARAPWPYTLDDAHSFIAIKPNMIAPNFMVFRITYSAPELIGSCGLVQHDEVVELGYWIARSHWGHGYASEAAQAVMNAALSLGHDMLHAGYFADNPASGNVLRKCGFVQRGPIRQIYSLGRSKKADFIPMIADNISPAASAHIIIGSNSES